MEENGRTYEQVIAEEEAKRRKKFNNLRDAKKDIWWSIHGAIENVQYWDEDFIDSLTEAQKERYYRAFKEISDMIAKKAGFARVTINATESELRQV